MFSMIPRRAFAPALALALGAFASAAPARAQVIGASWANANSGTLNGISFTMTGGDGLFPTDLSGPDYSGYELGSNETTRDYSDSSAWTATFSSPVTDPLLYVVFWRGGATFTFDKPFTIVAGSPGNQSGNSLSTPGGFADYSNGVLQFSGSISSLSITSVSGATGGSIAMTFGVQPAAIPEPGAPLLAGVALAGAAAARLARRRGRRAA